MHLVLISFKPCWADPDSPTGHATDGGFPFQAAALAELFTSTTVVVPRRPGPAPGGLTPLVGDGLTVRSFPEPPGQDLRRKLALLLRLPAVLAFLWREMGRADVVHAVVPGDIGALAIPLAVLRRKRLFVRHCGTWGRPVTVADRFLHLLLVRLGRRDAVVFATGGGDEPPEPGVPAIRWIFSTSLTAAEMARRPPPAVRRAGEALRLASVGRLTAGKNTAAVLAAVEALRRSGEDVVLDVLGHGPERPALVEQARRAGLLEAVRFHGNVAHDEVLAVLDRAHALVFPTRVAEGFPKAVLEAMACGAVVVAPRVSVLPHLLGGRELAGPERGDSKHGVSKHGASKHGVSKNGVSKNGGLLLDDTTPAAIADALRRLIDDPDEAVRRAAEGQRRASAWTLESWRDTIGDALRQSWGVPPIPP